MSEEVSKSTVTVWTKTGYAEQFEVEDLDIDDSGNLVLIIDEELEQATIFNAHHWTRVETSG